MCAAKNSAPFLTYGEATTVSTIVSIPGHRNNRIRNSVRAPTKKPVGETPTGSALFDYLVIWKLLVTGDAR